MRGINIVDECKFKKRWTEKLVNFLAFPEGQEQIYFSKWTITAFSYTGPLDSYSLLDLY